MNVMKKNTKKVNCPLCQNSATHEMSSNDLMFKKKIKFMIIIFAGHVI